MARRIFFQSHGALTASELFGRTGLARQHFRLTYMEPFGVKDCAGIFHFDGRATLCTLFVPLAKVTPSVPRRLAATLHRLAVHLATTHRLRAAGNETPSAEAVLRPDGRIEHVEAGLEAMSMRQALREHAKRVDQARAKLRRSDPDAAVQLWEGLASGEFSLLDRFESDGRRYLIAVRNAPGLQSGLALSRRETHIAIQAASGQPIKLIAYSLGLSPSTVSGHLASAMRKLGTPTRAELARCLAGFPRPEASRPRSTAPRRIDLRP